MTVNEMIKALTTMHKVHTGCGGDDVVILGPNRTWSVIEIEYDHKRHLAVLMMAKSEEHR